VVSFGRLGVLGRKGWFCRDADVDRWNALAGYRGLRDPAVRQHFNGTFVAFDSSWGPNQELMTNLDLRYDVAYLRADRAADAIRARLDAGLPAFFYLWSPHAFNARYSLNRIQLPAYTPELFELGLSDYPTDVLEKVASKTLSEHSPDVAKLYSLFRIDNPTQESMLATIDSGLSAMQATCAWMRKEENALVWGAWLPVAQLACDPGSYAVDESSCVPCPAGSASVGGAVSTCTSCSAGTPTGA
jgi:ABC-type proline/glycine betaine transport system substrate-binding protein